MFVAALRSSNEVLINTVALVVVIFLSFLSLIMIVLIIIMVAVALIMKQKRGRYIAE